MTSTYHSNRLKVILDIKCQSSEGVKAKTGTFQREARCMYTTGVDALMSLVNWE